MYIATQAYLLPNCSFKGTVSRDFRLLVFFMNQFPPSMKVYHYGHLEFFRKFAEIFAREYLRECSKKFEMTLMLFSGAWGKVVHEKNLKKKISWHCPFKGRVFKKFSKSTLDFRVILTVSPIRGVDDSLWVTNSFITHHHITDICR